MINDQSISIANPEDGSPLWTLNARDEGKVFFSSQLKMDHFRKLKNNRFLRLGLSFERGRDLLVGELENSAGEFSEFYQNNFAIKFHIGIMLRSDNNKI